MKNIFKILSAALLGLLLASCERDDTLAVAELKTNPEIVSTLSATSYVISDTNLSSTFETIVFKKPSFFLKSIARKFKPSSCAIFSPISESF